ncbi:MAG: hypothetical protein KOO63_00220 [Bacteroidales bacterium]|nr:hypothetical protein [Candidatus Latescibacterota bacterium]
MEIVYKEVMQEFDELFALLADIVPAPVAAPRDKGIVFRYVEQSIEQAIIQKLTRYISGLRAARVLLDRGFLQESTVLQRTLDEFGEDIMFLSLAVVANEQTAIHETYLKAFYADDFENTNDPMGSIRNRQKRVTRKEVRKAIDQSNATIATRVGGEFVSATEQVWAIGKLFSGFVHGGSPQIMEMYGGKPPHFHLEGMPDIPLVAVHEESFWNQYYRCGQSFAIAAQALGSPEVFSRAQDLLKELERAAGKAYDG